MTLDAPTALAIGGVTLGIAGLIYIAGMWSDLIDESFGPPLTDDDEPNADCRTTGLANEVFHFGTDTMRRRNDHAGR